MNVYKGIKRSISHENTLRVEIYHNDTKTALMGKMKGVGMEGQLTITDYLKSQIELKQVMDLTEWINQQGDAQYFQVKKIIKEFITDEELLDRITNKVSIYILEQSMGYAKYLRRQTGLEKNERVYQN